MISVGTLITELIFLNALEISGVKNRPTLLMVFLIGLFSVSFYLDLQNDKKFNYLKQQLLIGYFCRLGMLFFDIYGQRIYTLPNSGADSEMFFNGAIAVYNGAETGRTFFPVVMGYIYRWIGVSRLYGQFLVMLCSIASVLLLARMMSYLNISKDVQVQVMTIVAVLPNVVILSSIFLRESIVTMFVTISLYCYVRWTKHGNEIWYLVSFGAVALGALFHSGVAGCALGLILVRLLYDRRNNRIHFKAVNVVMAVIFSIGLTYVYLNYGDMLFSKMQGVENIGDIANTNEAGGSSYAAYVGNSDSLANMVVYTLPRIAYFLFSPFPWQWRGFRDIIAFFGSSLFYILSVYIAIKSVLKKGGKNRAVTISIMLIAIGVVFVFAWGCSNVGTASRHREKMAMIFALLWALGTDSLYNSAAITAGNYN